MTEITNASGDADVQRELGRRLRQLRLNQGLSQADLAARAGISELTLRKIEGGSLGNTSNFLSLLRELGRLDSIEAVVPASRVSPIALSDRNGIAPQRVRVTRRRDDARPWEWGEDE